MKNKTLKNVFHEIEKSSEYIFFYNDEAVDVNKKVDIVVSNVTIFEILNEILDRSTSNYTVSDRQVIISRNHSNANEIVAEVEEVKQTHSVTGKITDMNREPLIGVTVYEKGKPGNGTSTDVNGNYAISLKNGDETLVFSYIGFQPTEEKVAGRSIINVLLAEEPSALDEVVVVAYGTQRKNTVSGSLSTIKADRINATAPTISAMLQGQVAGMNVSQSSGKPGEGGSSSFVV